MLTGFSPVGLRLPAVLEGTSVLRGWGRAHGLGVSAQVRGHVEKVSSGPGVRGGDRARAPPPSRLVHLGQQEKESDLQDWGTPCCPFWGLLLLTPRSGLRRAVWTRVCRHSTPPLLQGPSELSRRCSQVRPSTDEPRLQLPGTGGLHPLPAGKPCSILHVPHPFL